MNKIFHKWFNGLYIARDKFQGWAVNYGYLSIIRFGNIIKIIASKDSYKGIKKAIRGRDGRANLLFDCYINKPYEAKSVLNNLLKNNKTSHYNNYEYKICDADLLTILTSSKIKWGSPMHGELAEMVKNEQFTY